MSVVNTGKPDLVVGLIKLRYASERAAEEVGMVTRVVEVIATVVNVGEGLANETTTRFWVEGADINRELRIVHTPELPPGEEIEVTALWDVRQRQGAYTITVTADAFSQIREIHVDNNSATVRATVRDTRVELA
jgi:subtilase family serine protease